MGVLLKMKCLNCGYEEVFQIGRGIKDNNVEYIISCFGDKVKDKVKKILENQNESSEWNFDRAIGQCNSCEKLYQRPVLIIDESFEEKRIFDNCECGGIVNLWVSDETSDIQKDKLPVCPKCKKTLVSEKVGFWD